MRPSILIELDDELAKAVTFDLWPVVPVQWKKGKLVTEPTPPGVKEWAILDTKRKGLSLRVTPKTVSWSVRRKRPKGSETWRKDLGGPPGMKVKVARTLADAWFSYIVVHKRNPDHDDRKDAQAETEIRRARKYTFGELYLDFIKNSEARAKMKDLRPSSVTDIKAVVKWLHDQPFWLVPVADLSPEHAEKLFAQWFVGAENARIAKDNKQPLPKVEHTLPLDLAAAHKALAHSRAAWNFTKSRKQVVNPISAWASGKKLPPVPRRQTVLKIHQASGQAWLKELVAQRDSEDALLSVTADYVLVATLWGGRKSETAALRWCDVFFSDHAARFIGATTKNGQDHWLPLTPWCEEVLTARRAKSEEFKWPVGPLDPVFYSPDTKDHRIGDYRLLTRLLERKTRPPDKLEEKSGEWITLHDLRRTLASSVFGTVKDLGTVAVALGHKSDHEVTMGYLERQQALAALREIYAAREKKLRVLIGLDKAPSTDQLSLVQQARVEDIQALLQKANLTDLSPEQLGTLLLSMKV
jgi:integrase